MVITREQAKIWCNMTPEQRSLTAIPEENYDVVKAYSEGKDILLGGRSVNTLSFVVDRKNFTIVEPKWEPKGGNFYITSAGGCIQQIQSDEAYRNHGIEFVSREAAIKAAKYYHFIHRLYKLAEELNEGWEPDWSKLYQDKYHVYFCCYRKQWQCDNIGADNYLVPVFKSVSVAKKAVEILNQEDKYWE